MRTLFGFLALTTLLAGCSFAARSDDVYERDVKTLLETKGEMVANCWGEVRKTDEQAQGTVTVKFRVVEDTGALESPEIDPTGTTASEPVQQCVLQSLDGLVLEPPDNRPAVATYVWELGAP